MRLGFNYYQGMYSDYDSGLIIHVVILKYFPLPAAIEWKDGKRIKHARSGRPSRLPLHYQGIKLTTLK